MKYIGFYGDQHRKDVSPAAVSKMDYIISCLNRLGHKVDIISCSIYGKERGMIQCDNMNRLLFFFNYSDHGGRITSRLRIILMNIYLFFYLMLHVKKNEYILVYHSLYYMRCIKIAKKIKKFVLILEVEEFYNDVCNLGKNSSRLETSFINCANKYLFATKLIEKRFNTFHKPYAIVHGNYQSFRKSEVSFHDDKIHIVYAGTFDMVKGGVIAAIKAAQCLNEKYCLHILGFGTVLQINKVKKLVDESGRDGCTIIYEGLKTGKEYLDFLCKCDIGLSTQNPVEKYNESSFPSKILSYLGCGLRVVTVKIPAVVTSDVGSILYYYDEQTPEAIAKAVKSIDFQDKFNPVIYMNGLDQTFLRTLTSLIR